MSEQDFSDAPSLRESPSEEMIEAGCAAYAQYRSLFSVLILPWTSRRLGIGAAYRAMRRIEESARKDGASQNPSPPPPTEGGA